jgi:hypothetical protein
MFKQSDICSILHSFKQPCFLAVSYSAVVSPHLANKSIDINEDGLDLTGHVVDVLNVDTVPWRVRIRDGTTCRTLILYKPSQFFLLTGKKAFLLLAYHWRSNSIPCLQQRLVY